MLSICVKTHPWPLVYPKAATRRTKGSMMMWVSVVSVLVPEQLVQDTIRDQEVEQGT